MPVLKKPMCFGFATLHFVLCGLMLTTGRVSDATEESSDTAIKKIQSVDQTSESGVVSDDPPLLDLSDLLSLLGEIPTLNEVGFSGGAPMQLTCSGESETVKAGGTVDLNSNSQNPLRSQANTAPQGSKAANTAMPGPSTVAKPEKVDPASKPIPSKVQSPNSKPLELALELELETDPKNSKSDNTDTPDMESVSDLNSSSKVSPKSKTGPEVLEETDEAESKPSVPKIRLPSDPPALMADTKKATADETETLVPAELETIAELKMIPIDDSESSDANDDGSNVGSVKNEVGKQEKVTKEIKKEIDQNDPTKEPRLGKDEISPKATVEKSREPFQHSETPKTRPKMVKVKPITEQDQEAPKLDKTVVEMDSRQAREEDEKAVEAKRPTASKKSFIESQGPATVKSTKPAIQQTPAEVRRQQRVENCLSYYIANPETVVERSPWAVMHAFLPFGVEGEVMVGNKRVNSIQWMCYNGTCRTQKIFTPVGRTFRPNIGGGVQGHEGQFLAMLAQSQVSADYPIVVGKNRFSVLDLVRYEMATCQEKTELTFKLIALSYYVDTNQSWMAADRKRWNIEKLVEQELAQPIVGSACGGTHRLMGLTFALRQRAAEGRPIDGHYARAEKYIADYIEYAWSLQNPDGSFSTNWFESRGEEQNKERKVQTTGHILEWLMFTLPKEQLKDPRVAKSIDFLLANIWDNRSHKWPIGPRGHATRAVALYQQRVYGVQPGQRHAEMAARIESLKLRR